MKQRRNVFLRIILMISLLLLVDGAAYATPRIVQSLVVKFPSQGRVIVQAREEAAKFPQMLFVAEKTSTVLLHSSIQDKDKWLMPEANRSILSQPALRFRVIRSPHFATPLIMAVGIYHGGSDNAFYLTVFGEVGGKIRRLNQSPMFASIQGGYYLGYLNKKYGAGLAVWNFIWETPGHYGLHRYEIALYRIRNGQLTRTLHTTSRKMYDWDKGFYALGELGIKAHDQRSGIPEIQDNLQ